MYNLFNKVAVGGDLYASRISLTMEKNQLIMKISDEQNLIIELKDYF